MEITKKLKWHKLQICDTSPPCSDGKSPFRSSKIREEKKLEDMKPNQCTFLLNEGCFHFTILLKKKKKREEGGKWQQENSKK